MDREWRDPTCMREKESFFPRRALCVVSHSAFVLSFSPSPSVNIDIASWVTARWFYWKCSSHLTTCPVSVKSNSVSTVAALQKLPSTRPSCRESIMRPLASASVSSSRPRERPLVVIFMIRQEVISIDKIFYQTVISILGADDNFN